MNNYLVQDILCLCHYFLLTLSDCSTHFVHPLYTQSICFSYEYLEQHFLTHAHLIEKKTVPKLQTLYYASVSLSVTQN